MTISDKQITRRVKAQATRALIVAMAALTLVLGGCRTNRPAELRPESVVPTNTKTDSEPEAEKPDLGGLIEHVSMYPVPNQKDDLAVSVVVTVRNSGLASTSHNWTLEVTSPGQPPTTVAAVHVNGKVEMPGTNGAKVDLGKEDLVLKTAGVPIAKGASVKGILTFVLAKTSESSLSNNNTTLVVHFKDSQGNSYQTPKSIIGGKAAKPSTTPRN